MQSYFNIKNMEKFNTILDRLDNICGMEKVKETLEKYVRFINTDEKISLGNRNILIECKSSMVSLEPILKVIKDLYMVATNKDIGYRYIEVGKYEDDDYIKVLDCDRMMIFTSFQKNKLFKYVKNNIDTPFIFIFREEQDVEFYMDVITNNLAYWRIELDDNSLNSQYILNLLEANHLEVNKSCRILQYFNDRSFNDIEYEMFHLILECRINGIQKITNKTLDELHLFLDKNESNVKIKADKKSSGYQDLEKMVGLENVKTQVKKIVNYLKVAKKRNAITSLHMVFEGNPGTGKTEVSRAIGKIFAEEQILSNKNVFVEATRADLVGEYIRPYRT